MSIKVVEDHGTYTSESSWDVGDYYCPNCGERTVYEENGEGDYYVGPDLICVLCSAAWTMQGPRTPDDYYSDKPAADRQRERVRQIKEAVR